MELVAYAAVTSIATIGLYIAYAIPIYLRLRLGDAWEPGEWNLGRHYKWIGVVAMHLGRVHRGPVHGAAQPGRRSVEQRVHVARGQLCADCGDRTFCSSAAGGSSRPTSGSRARSRRAPRRSSRGSRRSTARSRRRCPRRRLGCILGSEGAGSHRLPPRQGGKRGDARRAQGGGRGRDDRHGRLRVHRHAGPADRQARARGLLPLRVGRARARGLQLPARPRHGDGPAARLRDGELGARLRRLPPPARPRDAAADPVARGDGARALRRGLGGRLAGRRLAAAGARARRSSGRARRASSRWSAPSSSSTC